MEKIILPQDTMTPGQLKKQNGKVELYSLGQPMEWQALLSMPADLRKEYLEKLRDEYKATQIMLAGMLGIGVSTMRRYCKKWNIYFPKTGGYLSEKDRQRWAKFLGEQYKPAEPKPAADECPEPVEHEPAKLVPRSGSMTFHGPACDALRTVQEALRDTPCSLTISWEVEG